MVASLCGSPVLTNAPLQWAVEAGCRAWGQGCVGYGTWVYDLSLNFAVKKSNKKNTDSGSHPYPQGF